MNKQIAPLFALLFVVNIACMNGAEHTAASSKLQPLSPLVTQAHIQAAQRMHNKYDPSGAFYRRAFDAELYKLMRAARLEQRAKKSSGK